MIAVPHELAPRLVFTCLGIVQAAPLPSHSLLATRNYTRVTHGDLHGGGYHCHRRENTVAGVWTPAHIGMRAPLDRAIFNDASAAASCVRKSIADLLITFVAPSTVGSSTRYNLLKPLKKSVATPCYVAAPRRICVHALQPMVGCVSRC